MIDAAELRILIECLSNLCVRAADNKIKLLGAPNNVRHFTFIANTQITCCIPITAFGNIIHGKYAVTELLEYLHVLLRKYLCDVRYGTP